MLTQTLAIFHDAYRELNARKMFWVVLALSGLIVLVFAAVGIENRELTVFGLRTPIPIVFPEAEFYRLMFTTLGIGVWLTFAATILAVISTASIFPDFVSGGAIDLYLSKPLGRLRLFLTKYAAGLLFVALQVLVFAAASFVVIGVRAGTWEPRLFLAVPVVVCFFSYLYCVSTLVGVLTRSTIAAILLTVLAWFGMWLVGTGEVTLLMFRNAADREARQLEPQVKVVEGQIAFIEKQSPERRASSAEILAHLKAQRADLLARRDGGARRNLRIAHNIVYGVKTALPKTGETTDLLGRWLLSDETMRAGELDDADDDSAGGDGSAGGDATTAPTTRPGNRRRNDGPFSAADAAQAQEAVNTRPVRWVIGTSLAFEAVVLALAAWVFCRRDY